MLRLNPIEIRCANCKSKYKLKLHWAADWFLHLTQSAILFGSMLSSIYMLSVWPFIVGLAAVVAVVSIGQLTLDRDDAVTRLALRMHADSS